MDPATSAQTPTETPAASPLADPTQDHLAQIMERAAAAANAQRDAETLDESPPAESGSRDDEELGDDTDPGSPKPAEPADKAQEGQGKPAEPEPPKKYSRRDAARLDDELGKATKELELLRGQVGHATSTDREILNELADLSGAQVENNGKSRFDNLAAKVLAGRATADEKRSVEDMTQWRQLAGPIYRQAQQVVWKAFGLDFARLQEPLDKGGLGIDKATFEALKDINQTPDPVTLVRKVYDHAVKATEQRLSAENTRLKAENSELRTRTVAAKPQPAVVDGVGANGRTLPPMLLEDGRLNPEYEKLASSGALLGATKLTN